MSVNFIQMDFIGRADVNPRQGVMVSNDTLATITAAGYLNKNTVGIGFRETDFIFAAYSNGSGGVSKDLFQVNISSTGIVTLVLDAGTVSQISTGAGLTGGPIISSGTIAIEDNVVLPGDESVTIPIGATADEPAAANGMMRYDTDTDQLRAVIDGAWENVITSSAPGIKVITAGTFTPTNGVTSETIAIPSADVGDLVLMQPTVIGTGGNLYIARTEVTSLNNCAVNYSTDPGTGATVAYIVIRIA